MLRLIRLTLVVFVIVSFFFGCPGSNSNNGDNPTPKHWSTPQLIIPGVVPYGLQAHIDSAGNAIAVWVEEGSLWNVWPQVYANRYDAATGSWGETKKIHPDWSDWESNPSVGVDSNGNAVAVWKQDDDGKHAIWANRYDVTAASWGAAELIEPESEPDVYVQNPRVWLDSTGNALAVWLIYDGIRFNIRANRYDAVSGSWGEAELIETDDAGRAYAPQVGIDSVGNAIAVWNQSDGVRTNIWSNRYDAAAGIWGTAELIETDNTGDAGSPQIRVDSTGNAIAVWSQSDGIRTNIWSNRYDAAAGIWGTAELIETDDAGDAGPHQIEIDAAGNAIVVWNQSDGIRTNIWSNRYDAAAGIWGTAELIETDNTGDAGSPQIRVDSTGNAIAVWSQSDGSRTNIWSNRYDAAAGIWGTAELIETDDAGDADSPQIRAFNTGNAIAIWSQSDGSQLTYRANSYDAASGSWGSSELIQTKTDLFERISLRLAANSVGNAMVFWDQTDVNEHTNIWASHYGYE